MTSKRHRSAALNTGGELRIDMSPMIDMVFLLLIFFLLNSSLAAVKMDKQIEVPVAQNSSHQDKKGGRIVMNVYGDGAEGRYRDESGERVFYEDAQILQYLKLAKSALPPTMDPQLHLRGDRNAQFKHCRRVIRLAAELGIEQVIFASYANPNQYSR